MDLPAKRPLVNLLLALMTGIITVLFFGCLAIVTWLVVFWLSPLGYELEPQGLEELSYPVVVMLIVLIASSLGMIVHLWLLLLLVGVVGFRFIQLIFKTIGYAQWFLKQGTRHPLKAVGVVASTVVFLSGLTIKLIFVLMHRAGIV